jgi:crotonobetainyl-CoA:carnitine CoA-transferase CaiB-like acyl-CoA transferase
MAGALDGVVVADFSRVLAGPYATMLLGDLGAEVIKVERPGQGDDTRHWGPPYDDEGRATYFEAVNRNKRSVAIDLRSPAGAAAARDLALRADVLIENFVPGTMDRFGLGWDTLRAGNPGLVYCSINGFGAEAGASLPGYDLLVQAVGGLMSVTGPAPDQPTKVGVAVVDVITGLHAGFGVLAALRHRDQTGEGQRIEVSLLTSLLSALVNHTSAYLGAGVSPAILGNAHPSIVPYESYPTADRPLVLAVGNDTQFTRLCEVLGVPDLARDPRFSGNPGRVANRAALNAELVERLATATAHEWYARLSPAGVACGPINDLPHAVELAQQLGLHPVVEIADPLRRSPSRHIAHPVRYSATPPHYDLAPPALAAESAGLT